MLVDTPGLHRPRTLLGERLNDLVRTTWAEVDVVAVCFPANEKIGPGDRFIVTEMAKVRRTTKVAIATKTDLATPERIGEHLLDIQRLGAETGTEWAEIVPVSAKSPATRSQLLADLLVGLLPEGPQLYPDGDLTDAPEEILVAELIREAALEGVRDELPHSIAVVVEEMGLREGRPEDRPLLDIHANLYVERDSQKGIVIGHKGARLKEVGTRARKQIEAMLGTPGLPRPAREDRQGLAARPPTAAQAGLLMPGSSRSRPRRGLARDRAGPRPRRPRRTAGRRRGVPLAGRAHAPGGQGAHHGVPLRRRGRPRPHAGLPARVVRRDATRSSSSRPSWTGSRSTAST